MHSVWAILIVASLAYLGTMFDNFFAFAAQLVVTERRRYRRVSWGQGLGVAVLLVLASGVSSLLAPIPTRWIGILAIVPWTFAVYAWRHRKQDRVEQYRRGAVTTFVVTLALGGDNLAVWIPLLRATGVAGGLLSSAVFALWEIVFVLCAQALASHPRVVSWGTRRGPAFVPLVYVALGVLILLECGTFA